jgi:hypothetical protein
MSMSPHSKIEVSMRRSLLLLPAVLAAVALPTATAFAGEGDDDSQATLRAPQGCVSGDHATAAVSGDDIDRVAFFLDGNHVRTVTRPNDEGRWVLRVNCSHLRLGAHRARAVVEFDSGSSSQTLRFQLTRTRQGSPRFAG